MKLPAESTIATVMMMLLPVGVGRRSVVDGGDLIVPKQGQSSLLDGYHNASDHYASDVLFPGGVSLANGGGKFYLNVYRPPALGQTDEIQLFFQITDNSPNAADSILIYFDVDHDHSATAVDSGLVLLRDVSGTCATCVKVTTVNPNGSPIASTNLPGPGAADQRWVVFSQAGSWTAEVRMKASDLGLSDLPSLMGMYIRVVNVLNAPGLPPPPDGYPTAPGAQYVAPISSWANLKTRYPIEYIVVLDQSGSMLFDNKWTNAKNATNLLANAMAILRDDHFQDKIGVATFSWNNGANTDQTVVAKPLSAITAFPLDNYADAAPPVSSPSSNFYTPIGKGLDAAFSALGSNQSNTARQTQRVVLLLSDGLHNRPTTPTNQVPLGTGYLSYDPCPGTAGWNPCPSNTEHRVKVSTVAFGSAGGVDEALLTNIKNRFGGDVSDPQQRYNISGDAQVVNQFFLQSLGELYQSNLVYGGAYSAAQEFVVNSGEHRLIVVLSWLPGTNPLLFALERRVPPATTWTSVPCDVSSASVAVGFGICAVFTPAAGSWRVAGSLNPAPASEFALVDLNLRARFAIDQKVHGTGQDIVLNADLREAGVPVTSDPAQQRVTVRASIKRPGEGFGDYVSVRTLDRCEPQPPALPPLKRDSSASGRSQTANIDLKPARFQKLDSLFALCAKDSLVYVEDAGVQLFDDGSHGDATPNDGVYTLRFLNTQYEGSYVFRFTAKGISPSGSAFTRVQELAEYVRVEVDPSETISDSRVYSASGNTIVREFYVIPRDRFRRYLGPGYPDQVQFQATGGALLGSVRDYNNGIYSQFLRFDETKDRPVVRPVVQGKPLPAIRVFKPFELVLPFAGRFFLADTLGLQDGTAGGAQIGYRFKNQLTFGIEGAVTFTRDTAGNSGKVVQALGNLRYDIHPLRIGKLIPHLTAGIGYVWFGGFGRDDEAVIYQGGAGFTLQWNSSRGVRVDARALRIADVLGAGATTSLQARGGLVWWF